MPQVRWQVAQGVQRGGRDVQGLRLLPQRFARDEEQLRPLVELGVGVRLRFRFRLVVLGLLIVVFRVWLVLVLVRQQAGGDQLGILRFRLGFLVVVGIIVRIQLVRIQLVRVQLVRIQLLGIQLLGLGFLLSSERAPSRARVGHGALAASGR
jgi:hypothetical protein